ncbi:MAG: hypothetical protein H0X36_07900 [Sphingomonadaceae bacterium]|nr:hypothetical protein [Sphingomonadaceae bacterium]
MSSDAALVITLSGLVIVYVLTGYMLLRRGWLLGAGLAMLLIAVAPVWVEHSDAPGDGFLVMMMTPVTLLLIGAGLIGIVVRASGALSEYLNKRTMPH